MKIDVTIKTASAALVALRLRAIEAEAEGHQQNAWRAAFNELEAAVQAAIAERLAEEPDDSLTLHPLHH